MRGLARWIVGVEDFEKNDSFGRFRSGVVTDEVWIVQNGQLDQESLEQHDEEESGPGNRE